MRLQERVYRLMRGGFRGTDVEIGAAVGTTRHGARSMISAINAEKPGSIVLKKVPGQRKGKYEHTSPIVVPPKPMSKRIVKSKPVKKTTIIVPDTIKVEVSGVMFSYTLIGPV